MQGHLVGLEKRGRHGEICSRLRQAMADERQRTGKEVAEAARVERWLSRVGHWMALRGSLLAREEEIGKRVVAALSEQFGAFAEQAERLSAGVLGEQGHGDIEPHALRIAGKSLRYTFEMAQVEGLPVADATLRIYKKLQDALGLWHDYHVLSQHIMQCCLSEMQHPPFRRDEDEMMQLAVKVIRDSHRELAVFAKLWRKHRAQLTEQLAGVLPHAPPTPVVAAAAAPAPVPST
jgi:CHAD domain-containing protein